VSVMQWIPLIAIFSLGAVGALYPTVINLADHVNLYYYLAFVADECFNPDTKSGHRCFDESTGLRTSGVDSSVCLSKDDEECTLFSLKGSTSANLQSSFETDLLISAVLAFAVLCSIVLVWGTVVCFAPIWWRPYGLYHVLCDRSQIAKHEVVVGRKMAEQRRQKLAELELKRHSTLDGDTGPLEAIQSLLDEEGGRMKNVFDRFDQQGRGVITRKDFSFTIKSLAPTTTETELDYLWDLMDAAQSGEVGLGPFSSGIKKALQRATGDYDPEQGGEEDGQSAQEAWNHIHNFMASNGYKSLHLFREVDANGSGKLDRDEFTTGLERIGLELSLRNLEGMWASMDSEDTGLISYSEFAKALKANPLA